VNRGLLTKAWRETWTVTLLCGVGLALLEAVEGYTLVVMKNQVSTIMEQFGPLERFLRTLVGADRVLGQFGPEAFPAIAWGHPLALAFIWGHAILFCTRVPVGEVDRGTIDVLLGLPVSRRQLFLIETFVWLSSGVCLLVLWVAGNRFGNSLANGPRLDLWRLTALVSNLLGLYTAVGGFAWLMSALSDRRGRAVGAALGFVLFAFLVSYLAPFWSVAERLSFLSLLHYHVPLTILQEALWPVRDVLILNLLGVAFWATGGIVFGRRDLATL